MSIMTEELRNEIMAADLCCEEQVCDAVLAVAEAGGDWREELSRAKTNDAAERAALRMSYTIHYTDGRTASHDSYEAAVAAIEREYPEAEIGHSGDLADFGDRTLCWADEASSVNDDGARAVASIRRA